MFVGTEVGRCNACVNLASAHRSGSSPGSFYFSLPFHYKRTLIGH